MVFISGLRSPHFHNPLRDNGGPTGFWGGPDIRSSAIPQVPFNLGVSADEVAAQFVADG